MSESRILVRLLRMYFPWNWEFGSALSKLRNFGGGFEHTNLPPPLVRHCHIIHQYQELSMVIPSIHGTFFLQSQYNEYHTQI